MFIATVSVPRLIALPDYSSLPVGQRSRGKGHLAALPEDEGDRGRFPMMESVSGHPPKPVPYIKRHSCGTFSDHNFRLKGVIHGPCGGD